jgi:hypothetical protein
MLDFTKTEKYNIKVLYEYIQQKSSDRLAYFFRVNFLEIDEIQENYMAFNCNTFDDIKKEVHELKSIIQDFGFYGKIYF